MSVDYVILTIGSLAFACMVLAAGWYFSQGVIHGACWENTLQDLHKIQSEAASLEIGKSKNLFIEFGADCTDAVIIMNREPFERMVTDIGGGLGNKFSCLDGVKTTIAAVKKTDNSPSWVDVTKALVKSDRKTVEDWARAFVGLDKATHCTHLKCENCTFTGKGLTFSITGKSDRYCINIKRESQLEYTVRAELVEKQDQCLINENIV